MLFSLAREETRQRKAWTDMTLIRRMDYRRRISFQKTTRRKVRQKKQFCFKLQINVNLLIKRLPVTSVLVESVFQKNSVGVVHVTGPCFEILDGCGPGPSSTFRFCHV